MIRSAASNHLLAVYENPSLTVRIICAFVICMCPFPIFRGETGININGNRWLLPALPNMYTWRCSTGLFGTLHEKLYLLHLLTCASNEDSNQTVHPGGLIRVYIVRTTGYPKCAFVSFWSDCTNAMHRLIWILAGRTRPKVRFLALKLICW